MFTFNGAKFVNDYPKFGITQTTCNFVIDKVDSVSEELLAEFFKTLVDEAFTKAKKITNKTPKEFQIHLMGSNLDYPVLTPLRPHNDSSGWYIVNEIAILDVCGKIF